MRRLPAVVLLATLASPIQAQTRKAPVPPPRRPAAVPLVPLKKESVEVRCPTPLGIGVKTRLAFCDVMSGRDPAEGILITLPQHRGAVTLTFDLHNRHTY